MAGGIGVCKRRAAGVARGTCVLTRLSPWGRTGTIRSSWRARAIASQFSGPPLARQGRGKPVKLDGNVTFLHNTPGTFGQRSRTRPIRGAKSSHAEPPAKDFVPHVRDQVGSRDKSGSAGVSLFAKLKFPQSCRDHMVANPL
jgi:hypothetical protein